MDVTWEECESFLIEKKFPDTAIAYCKKVYTAAGVQLGIEGAPVALFLIVAESYNTGWLDGFTACRGKWKKRK